MRKPTFDDLFMLARAGSVLARFKHEHDTQQHRGILTTITFSDGTEAIWIWDLKRVHWAKLRIYDRDLYPKDRNPVEFRMPNGRYATFDVWVQHEENLREIAVEIIDQEYGVEEGTGPLIDDKEDDLREHFDLKPLWRAARHIGKPSKETKDEFIPKDRR